jgi:hypothetical protein
VGENGTGNVEKCTTRHTDTVKGVDVATNSDAFGITSFFKERFFERPNGASKRDAVSAIAA